jgi:hypothetical protein
MTLKHKYLIHVLSIVILISGTINLFAQGESFPLLQEKVITTSKTDAHQRVKGTRVFLNIPEDYKEVVELARHSKREKLYFQTIELHNPFSEIATNFEQMDKKMKEALVPVYNRLKFNGYDAIYSEGPSKFDGETKIGFWFGNDEISIMLLGVCKTDDKIGQNELRNIFASVYFDKDYPLNPLEIATFDFNSEKFGLKFSSNNSNMFMFEPDTVKNKKMGEEEVRVMIGTAPKMSDEKAEALAKDMSWRYAINGTFLKNLDIKKTSVGGFTAFALESKTENMDEGDGFVSQIVIVGEKSTLIFIGYCNDKNVTENQKLLLQIANSIKFKE